MDALRWARRQRTGSPSNKAALLVLADYADEAGVCWPGTRQLAEDCDTDQRTIRRILDRLRDAGLVSWASTGRRNGSRYRLHLDAVPTEGCAPSDPDASDSATEGRAPSELRGVPPLTEGCAPSKPSLPLTRTPTETLPAPAPPPRLDVDELCSRLHARIVENGSRATINDGWRNAARLLLDVDGRELSQALLLVDWCQADDFWRSNVLSMPTFRKQYDRLRLKAAAEHAPTSRRSLGRPTTDDKILDLQSLKTGTDGAPLLHVLPGGGS